MRLTLACTQASVTSVDIGEITVAPEGALNWLVTVASVDISTVPRQRLGDYDPPPLTIVSS